MKTTVKIASDWYWLGKNQKGETVEVDTAWLDEIGVRYEIVNKEKKTNDKV